MSEWISVEERLPEITDDAVLVYRAEHGGVYSVQIPYYFDDTTSGFDEKGNELYTKWYLTVGVTHWMPLPPPPEVEK